MPALPLDEAGKYVAGAYVVFVALILLYVAIMAAKLQRIERELSELAGLAEKRTSRDPGPPGSEAEDVPGSGLPERGERQEMVSREPSEGSEAARL